MTRRGQRTHTAQGALEFGVTLAIERLGARGEGISQRKGRVVYVPHALPGETVRADIDGDRASVSEVLEASPQRITSVCQHYGTCGGCAIQALERETYRAWKRELVVDSLARAGVEADVGALIDAHGEGRRRVTLHARVLRDGAVGPLVASGFMRARSHDIVPIEACPLLTPGLSAAPAIAHALAEELAQEKKPLDILITETRSGLDVDFRGTGPLADARRLDLARLAERLDLARLSNHGDIIIERRTPELQIGKALLNPPPGAFLQSTVAGEETLARLAMEAARGSKRIADLFAGIGTFALRLAEIAPVHAVEFDGAALRAFDRAARFAVGLKTFTQEQRDLFRRPLTTDELKVYDCVLLDPPRAGAEEQTRALAQSGVARVISVSCNAGTFARDAKILTDGGYRAERITPVDQFIYSPHVEIVGIFVKDAPKRKPRRLLG